MSYLYYIVYVSSSFPSAASSFSDLSLSCLWFLMLDASLPLNLLSALLSSRTTAWRR